MCYRAIKKIAKKYYEIYGTTLYNAIILNMNFKLCTKSPVRKAVRTEWVVWDSTNLVWLNKSLACV